jgi:hypothetical protein
MAGMVLVYLPLRQTASGCQLIDSFLAEKK